MKTYFLPILFCLIFLNSFGQRKPAGYLLIQYNKTIQDQTLGNNPWGVGIGFQAFLNNRVKFTPTIELTADIYLADDKVLRINDSVWPGPGYKTVRSMSNLFIGYSFHPTPDSYLAFSAGPSFVTGVALLGIKPSLGFAFSKNRKWIGKISYINVFDRVKFTKKNFSSYSLSIGYKLF
jgi:hypothetical protein